jgi:hypothetical protein
VSVSEQLGVSERLTVSEQLEEHEHKEHEPEPEEHEQLPKRPWPDIVVLILAAPVSNTVTRKILTEVIYRANFSSIANLLPPPQRPLLRLLDRYPFP